VARSAYTVTVRTGAKVRKERFDELAGALDAIDAIVAELADGASARPVGGTVLRRLEPVQQVVGRVELAGPDRLRAGVDVRGDGSTEAYTGRLRRSLVEQRDGEASVAALRRVLG
jgi:hypothetical protein